MDYDLEELEKCKNNMVYFIEKYCLVLNDRQKHVLEMIEQNKILVKL